MVDTLHHLPRPLDFLSEAARVLKPGGRLAMVEPWITAPSWVLYRFFHHEECRLGVDVARPFDSDAKAALDGNAAIPVPRSWPRLREAGLPLHLVRAEPFVGLPYLATFGFKVGRPLPALLPELGARGRRRRSARWRAGWPRASSSSWRSRRRQATGGAVILAGDERARVPSRGPRRPPRAQVGRAGVRRATARG